MCLEQSPECLDTNEPRARMEPRPLAKRGEGFLLVDTLGLNSLRGRCVGLTHDDGRDGVAELVRLGLHDRLQAKVDLGPRG